MALRGADASISDYLCAHNLRYLPNHRLAAAVMFAIFSATDPANSVRPWPPSNTTSLSMSDLASCAESFAFSLISQIRVTDL